MGFMSNQLRNGTIHLRTFYRQTPVKRVQDFFKYRFRPFYWKLQKALSGGKVKQSVADVKVEYPVESWREQYRYETLVGERNILEYLIQEIGTDDVVWDIGGSWGMFTTPIAATGADTSVFEPVPNRVERIQKNLSYNNLDATVYEFALGESEQDLMLELEGSNPGGLTESTQSGVPAMVRPGDDLIKHGATQPTVLKIDVEGAEVETLRGLENTLNSPECKLVVIEIHSDLISHFDGDEEEFM
jgi:FkbM family methyltransferase